MIEKPIEKMARWQKQFVQLTGGKSLPGLITADLTGRIAEYRRRSPGVQRGEPAIQLKHRYKGGKSIVSNRWVEPKRHGISKVVTTKYTTDVPVPSTNGKQRENGDDWKPPWEGWKPPWEGWKMPDLPEWDMPDFSGFFDYLGSIGKVMPMIWLVILIVFLLVVFRK